MDILEKQVVIANLAWVYATLQDKRNEYAKKNPQADLTILDDKIAILKETEMVIHVLFEEKLKLNVEINQIIENK